MNQASPDRYYNYDDLTRLLHDWAARFPNLLRLESIGRSYEGRDIWLASVTDFSAGPDHEKPALWVDGNIHSAELCGSTACLVLLYRLLHDGSSDPKLRQVLAQRSFYVCPRVNSDGAERALASPPKLTRSSVRPYPYDEEPAGGLRVDDIDGDGRILTMRIPDPNGPWKICPDEPRLLIPREPTESDGEYFRLLPEGTFDNFDGYTMKPQAKKERLDLNRNFPGLWREEHEQPGAGAYPASEPEVRAVVDFISRHNNIGAGIALHSYSGAFLRPYSYQSDESFIADDLWTYEKIGAKATELTGYPAVSAYHDFRYHPNEIITGALDDWLYDSRGLFAWTVEIWSPQRQAGITDFRLFDWYRNHPHEDDRKLLAWSDGTLGENGYVDWYPFNHAQLGEIALGGWQPLFSFWNPPQPLLAKEVSPIVDWLIWHARLLPRLDWLDVTAKPIGQDVYRLHAVAQNRGWLPTYISKVGLRKKLTRGVTFEITLPANVTILEGERRIVTTELEGRANKNCAPFGWAAVAADPTDERVGASWIVSAPEGSTIVVSAAHERAGTIRRELKL